MRSVLNDAGADEAAPADDGLEVRDAIARLEPRLAELVRLVHWDRLTLAQAADVLGLPASTVRNHYQRAREELRVSLGHAEATAVRASPDGVLPVADDDGRADIVGRRSRSRPATGRTGSKARSAG